MRTAITLAALALSAGAAIAQGATYKRVQPTKVIVIAWFANGWSCVPPPRSDLTAHPFAGPWEWNHAEAFGAVDGTVAFADGSLRGPTSGARLTVTSEAVSCPPIF
jgi:hypothetical protein